MTALLAADSLGGETSAKCVNHIELSVAGGGEDQKYQVGDALGAWRLNCADEIAAILKACGFTGKETIELKTEVRLTIGGGRYDLNGTPRKVVGCNYLGDRLAEGGAVGVYVPKSAHFHIPDDVIHPRIMIGSGAGIAPFRAFLDEREAPAATGSNWLFFGDQHRACDYLFQDQNTVWQESGLLTHTELA